MKDKKSLLVLLLSAVVVSSLLGCGPRAPEPAAQNGAPPAAMTLQDAYMNPKCKNQPPLPFRPVTLNETAPKDKKFDPFSACISKDRQEQVIWIANGNADLEVVFKDSPFEPGGPQVIDVPRGRPMLSGPIRADAAENVYSYDVRVKGTTNPIDPEIIVER